MRHAFDALTPDAVLDALDSVGLRGDGRLTALSSYENRVYQVQLEDGSAVVAKFYRPERWSDAQIQEEHDFAAELMAAEIPAVGPLKLQGPDAAGPQTLHHFGGFAFSVLAKFTCRAHHILRRVHFMPAFLFAPAWLACRIIGKPCLPRFGIVSCATPNVASRAKCGLVSIFATDCGS